MHVETLPLPLPAEGLCASYALSRIDKVLVVGLVGEASNRRECLGIYRLVEQAIMLTHEIFLPSSVVFDFTALRYESGDHMAQLIGNWGMPVAVVPSPGNEAPLRSLISSELQADPELWLFKSIESAVLAVTARSGEARAT
jgi:hypothetical protein